MFRCKQFFKPSAYNPIFCLQETVSPEGVLSSSYVRAEKLKPLPDASLFDLETMLKAKVPLEQLNCKLIPTSKPSFDSVGTAAEIEGSNKKAVDEKGVENE